MDNKKIEISDEKLKEIKLNSLINKILMLYVVKKANEAPPFLRGRIKFQKLFFLSELTVEQDRIKALTFGYFRYSFGPFSKNLFETYEDMEKHGLVKGSLSGNFELAKEGKYLFEVIESSGLYKANLDSIRIIDETIKKYGSRSGPELKNVVYKMKIPILNSDTHAVDYKEIYDIDTYIDLLPFYFIDYKKSFFISEDLADNLLYEFSLMPEDRENMKKRSTKTLEEIFAL
jgi:hypothetical protein